MAKYYLTPHTCACELDDGVIFLDLKQHRYLGLAREHVASLKSVVVNLNSSGNGESDLKRYDDGSSKYVAMLVEKGLLTCIAPPESSRSPHSVIAARAIDPDDGTCQLPAIRPHHLAHFITATILVALQLKFSRLEQIARKLRERREVRWSMDTRCDEARVYQLVTIFFRLRKWSYTATDACLRDTLTLVRFLSSHRLHATCVVAVTTKPFRAHCWAQYGDVVLNDTLEHVQEFTPILVV